MIALLLPALVGLAAASPINQGEMLTKAALPAVPKGWTFKKAAPANLKISMHIALKEQNMGQLQDRLMAMSTPGHADYGKHMTKTEIDALVAPSSSSVNSVKAWLESHGIKAGEISSGSMPIEITAAKAEELLGTKYGIYYNAAKDQYTVRTTEYSLPKAVHDHIHMVQPTTMFSDMGMYAGKAKASVSSFKPKSDAASDDCSFGITPSCLQSLYSINYTPTSNTTIGITGYLKEVASNDDLQSFLQQYTNIPAGTTFSVQLVNGGSNSGAGTTEADLDTQYAMALTYPIQNLFWETGGTPPFKPDSSNQMNTNEPYIDWLNYLNGLDSVPNTITSSYGDNEQTVPRDYADRVCDGFVKLAARGVSMLVSSGDGGVAGGQSSQCTSNDGSGKEEFLPTFPAACPMGITAVGGTQGQNPESGAQLSSGGFSNYYSAPSYQSSQTSAYIQSIGDQFQGLYNPQGRGIPDVAAQAYNYQVVVNGGTSNVDGTSCSSPTFASVVALLNDYLVSQGRSPLGFLNPFLYGKGSGGLTDITSGNNPGCGTDGFSAATGWDPVTGMGSPVYSQLQQLV